MILEFLLGIGATALSISNSKIANENAKIVNSLNSDTSNFIKNSLESLNFYSSRLKNTLSNTVNIKNRIFNEYTETYVYYLKHINDNVRKKGNINDEVINLSKTIKDYSSNLNELTSKHLDENTMLVSSAVGGLVLGAGVLGANALGTSLSLGLGISFFGIGSFLMSSYQLSKSQNALEEAKYLNDNKQSLKNDIEYKIEIIKKINDLFINYNASLESLVFDFSLLYKDVQRMYRDKITSSNSNMKLIADGNQPKFLLSDFDQNQQNKIYESLEKCKIISEYARTKILTNDGNIDYFTCKKLGVSYE